MTGFRRKFTPEELQGIAAARSRMRSRLLCRDETDNCDCAANDTFCAQRIEARSDETLQAAQPEGREPDGEADAPTPYRPTPTGEE